MAAAATTGKSTAGEEDDKIEEMEEMGGWRGVNLYVAVCELCVCAVRT
jgi:hypothetical protein